MKALVTLITFLISASAFAASRPDCSLTAGERQTADQLAARVVARAVFPLLLQKGVHLDVNSAVVGSLRTTEGGIYAGYDVKTSDGTQLFLNAAIPVSGVATYDAEGNINNCVATAFPGVIFDVRNKITGFSILVGEDGAPALKTLTAKLFVF